MSSEPRIANPSPNGHEQAGSERQSLTDEADTILAESRMVLPGIQALFGFQLIVPFNTRFEQLSADWQAIHLTALALGAVAMALVITPAAYHRLAERGRMSLPFIALASRFLAAGMAVLALSVVLDFLLVANLVLGDVRAAAIVAAVIACLFGGLWFGWPLTRARRNAGPSILRGRRQRHRDERQNDDRPDGH